GGFARAHFAGEQTGAMMIDQKLEPRLHLCPGLRSKQLLGVRAIAEGRFFETEEGFHHGYSFSSFFCLSSSTNLIPVGFGESGATGFAEGNWPLTTGSTKRAIPCGVV